MRNFYEATAIKHNLNLSLALTVTPIGQVPCLIDINGKRVFDDRLITTSVINHSLGLEDPLELTIQISRSHPDAVLVALAIDEIEIIPKYLHLAEPPTNYLDQTGIWTFKIPSFYPWLHQITGQGWIV